MGKIIDRIGQTFNRLTILGYDETINRKKRVICICSCGVTTKAIDQDSVVNGNTKSCGCFKHEKDTARGDGRTKEKLYRVHSSMKQRCFNENSCNYKNYGKRGITVCDEWKNSYDIFKVWAIENGYKEGLEIDRRDNNGNYTPENCRWVTRDININNLRKTILITHNGETKPLTEWAKIYNMTPEKLRSRYQELKMEFEDAVKPGHVYIKKELKRA